MTLDQLLSEIEARVKAATPGPWHTSGEYKSNVIQTAHITRDVWTIARCEHDGAVDAELIAAAPADLTTLLAIVAEYQRALDEIANETEESSHEAWENARWTVSSAIKHVSSLIGGEK